ncbi:MAG TPA: 4-oxalocrotonate tautomerase family protein [Syntrophorhabdales bacterium]|nr:4-oxalocrotonate tautomerase family protein [Syntrophorhabdales bacterium]
MPYVNIKVTKDGVTAEQKAALIQGVTKLLFDVLGKDPQMTSVVIDEVDTDNWGVAGESLTVRRKRQKAQKEGEECAPQEPSECFPADLCIT